jgi:L-ornithine N5-oxygenase
MNHREVELLGIGAGPSNLALAVALEELAPDDLARRAMLVEQQADTVWQAGMLMPWTRSQVSFLKDLVTLRNPQSKFTFINYLHSAGRLSHFINMNSFTPYRMEISDYLQWVARSLTKVGLQYNGQCTRLEPMHDNDGRLTGWLATFADNATIACRYLVIAAGRDPLVPTVFAGLPADRLIHSTCFDAGIAHMDAGHPHRIAVIGGGQSAAEMLWAAHQKFEQASLTIVMRSIGLANYAVSRFINELYFPSFVEQFYAAPKGVRANVLAQMHGTNYSGLDARLLDTLYEQAYIERVTGKERIRFVTNTDVTAVRLENDEVVLTLTDRFSRQSGEFRFDRVMLGTGFRKEVPTMIADLVVKLGIVDATVDRNYRLVMPQSDAGCYLQGVNEATHGISDSLLSVAAVRAEEIVADILRRRGHRLGSAPCG